MPSTPAALVGWTQRPSRSRRAGSAFTVGLLTVTPAAMGPQAGGIVAGLAGWPVSVGAFQGEAGPVGDRLGADEPKAAVLGLQVLDGAVAEGGYLFGIVWSLPRLGWDRLAGGLGAQVVGRVAVVGVLVALPAGREREAGLVDADMVGGVG